MPAAAYLVRHRRVNCNRHIVLSDRIKIIYNIMISGVIYYAGMYDFRGLFGYIACLGSIFLIHSDTSFYETFK